MSANLVKFRVGNEILVDALHLPRGTVIRHVSHDIGSCMYPAPIIIVAENKDLPAVEEGTEIPEGCPVLQQNENGDFEFVKWGTENDA